ncbi:MAG: ceramidase domain-containing protein [Candidatus Lokiarchaeota archaeon]|nr:ceramidase domain-containing protein [Candidatus Lokiarchaeota archaeon]
MDEDKKAISAIILGLIYSAAWIGGLLAMRAFFGYWPGEPSRCLAIGTCFCERNQPDQLVITPINAWTNMFYVCFGFAAIFMALRGRNEAKSPTHDDSRPELPNPMKSLSPYVVCYAFISITVGLMSWTMHAAWRKWGGFLDVYSMNLYIVFVLLYSLARERGWNWRAFITCYIVAEIVFFPIYWFHLIHPNLLFGIILVLAVVNEFRVLLQRYIPRQRRREIRRPLPLFLLTIVSFVVGFIIWNVVSGESDEPAALCDPDSWFQGHSVWHFLTALAMLITFRYMQGERIVVLTQSGSGKIAVGK